MPRRVRQACVFMVFPQPLFRTISIRGLNLLIIQIFYMISGNSKQICVWDLFSGTKSQISKKIQVSETAHTISLDESDPKNPMMYVLHDGYPGSLCQYNLDGKLLFKWVVGKRFISSSSFLL